MYSYFIMIIILVPIFRLDNMYHIQYYIFFLTFANLKHIIYLIFLSGNVIFGDYERDEEDCGLTRSQAKMGVKCPRAYFEMPLVDITPHPEYSR